MHEKLANMLSGFWDQGGFTNGLPAGAYTDADFWQAECDTLFSSSWVFAGFVHELKQPGDAIPLSVGGKPVFILRNLNGEISAFHNVCSHRCLELVEKAKNVGKLIRCPYHAWAYDHSGTLKASPLFGGPGNHQPQGFEPSDYGLKSIRTHVWQDWIFLDLSANAPEFEDYAAPLINRLAGIDFIKLEPIGTLEFGEIACNWKLIMENFIEPYHVPIVHSSTTRQPLNEHHTIIDGNCLGSGVDLKQEVGTDGSLAVSSRYLTLFPNFIIGRYFPDQLGVYLNVPLGPGHMRQKRALYTTEGKHLDADQIDALKKLWWDVHKEDHEMCERMQLGRQSPVADAGGVLSPHWENSVRKFQELVATSILSHKTAYKSGDKSS